MTFRNYTRDEERRGLDRLLEDIAALPGPLNATATGWPEPSRPLTEIERSEREARILRSAPENLSCESDSPDGSCS